MSLSLFSLSPPCQIPICQIPDFSWNRGKRGQHPGYRGRRLNPYVEAPDGIYPGSQRMLQNFCETLRLAPRCTSKHNWPFGRNENKVPLADLLAERCMSQVLAISSATAAAKHHCAPQTRSSPNLAQGDRLYKIGAMIWAPGGWI